MAAQTDDDISDLIPVENEILAAITELRRVMRHTTIKDAIDLTGAFAPVRGASILTDGGQPWLRFAVVELRTVKRETPRVIELVDKGVDRILAAREFFTESNVANFAAWAAVNGRNDASVGIRWTGNGTIRASAVNAFGELIVSATVKIPDMELPDEPPAPVEPVATGGGLKFW